MSNIRPAAHTHTLTHSIFTPTRSAHSHFASHPNTQQRYWLRNQTKAKPLLFRIVVCFTPVSDSWMLLKKHMQMLCGCACAICLCCVLGSCTLRNCREWLCECWTRNMGNWIVTSWQESEKETIERQTVKNVFSLSIPTFGKKTKEQTNARWHVRTTCVCDHVYLLRWRTCFRTRSTNARERARGMNMRHTRVHRFQSLFFWVYFHNAKSVFATSFSLLIRHDWLLVRVSMGLSTQHTPHRRKTLKWRAFVFYFKFAFHRKNRSSFRITLTFPRNQNEFIVWFRS